MSDEYLRGLRDAWNAVDSIIKHGPLPSLYENEMRNGLVLACNQIMALIGAEPQSEVQK